MFDGDTGCAPSKVSANKKLNTTILSLAGLDAASCWPGNDIFTERAVVWSKDIQEAMHAEQVGWFARVKGVCEGFGWDYDRLKKNPAVLSHALTAAHQEGTDFICLGTVVELVMSFVGK